MRRAGARAVLLLLAVTALGPAGAADGATSSLRNPVVPVTAPGDDTPDPWIFRHDGRYWLTYTTADHIEVRSAPELAGLASATPKRLWPPAGVTEPEERCCQVWAPEIHRLGGRWYVYYAANGPSGDTHRMYVLESAGTDPDGPYRFKAQLRLPQPYAIDGTVAQVGGKTYLIYSSGDGFAPTSLSIVPLTDPWTVGGPPVTISEPTLPWETRVFAVNEGPEVLRRAGKLSVIYSASWCGTGAYALGRLTVPESADLLDPAAWKAAKSPSPVFSRRPSRGIFGPGHGSFFTSPDGRESWMVYHATENDLGCFTGGARTTRAQRFTWNAGGTPDFGSPVSLSTDIAAPGGDGTIAVQAEDAARRPTPARRAEVVDDRRLFGYRGLRLEPAGRQDALPTLSFRVPRAGRYAAHVRVLGGPAAGTVTLVRADGSTVRRAARRTTPRALDIDLGSLSLSAGANVLRLRSSRALAVDQLRLQPRR